MWNNENELKEARRAVLFDDGSYTFKIRYYILKR
jgi:hypothetical protein